MNKKFLILLFICFIISSATFAAKYKVNGGGKVTNPSGKVQQTSVLQQQQVNTYTSGAYTANKNALTGQAAMIDIVMDYSGSMSNWIKVAQGVMSTVVYQIPSSTKIGFRVFGHDRGSNPYQAAVEKAQKIIKGTNGKYKAVINSNNNSSYLGSTTGSCSATSQIVPITSYNPNTLLTGMNSVNIGGSTPLTYALDLAVKVDFANIPSNTVKKIILITDGGENCGGDPCAFVRNLVAQRKDIIIDVVLVSSYSNNFQCLSSATGGRFYTANDNFDFSNALNNSVQQTVKTASPQTQTTQTQQQSQPEQNYEYIDF